MGDLIRSFRKFFRSPKGMLLLALLALTAIAFPVDKTQALTHEAAAAVSAALLDTLLFRLRGRRPQFPSGAILTGLIVAMVLSQTAPLYVTVLTALTAIASKHGLRTKRGHFFNPAAVGLLLSSAVFASEQSWWGGLGDLPVIAILALAIAGSILAERLNKFPAILSFMGVYFALFTAAALAGNPASVSDIFQEPFTGAALFFAFFMLTDPPTSPARTADQVWFGVVVAIASFASYMLSGGGVYYLPLGLIGGNLIEAVRRRATAGARPQNRPSPKPLSGMALG